MSECQSNRDLMIAAYYGELDAATRARFDRHIGSCPDCSSKFAALRSTLELMAKRRRTDPGPEFWEGYWDRLSRRMLWESIEEGRRPSIARRLAGSFARLPAWSLQAAGAAVLLVMGIWIGSRIVGTPQGAPRATAAASAAPSAAVVQAANYIERSKVLLLGLVNYDPAIGDAYALDFGRKKTISHGLAAEAPALRRALMGPGQKKLRDLVADLEVIMIQIANLEAGQDLEGIELVKQSVDQRGIFLKIDLDRMGRDSRAGASPASPKAGTRKNSKI